MVLYFLEILVYYKVWSIYIFFPSFQYNADYFSLLEDIWFKNLSGEALNI